MAKTRAMENKAIRQKALREQLSAQGHVQHVIDICVELNTLDAKLEPSDIQRKKIVIDTKLSLIKKYLPDLKPVSPTVEFEFPKEAKPHEQAVCVMAAVAGGLIPPDIGGMFITSIRHMIDIEEYTELKDRIKSIEEALNIPSE